MERSFRQKLYHESCLVRYLNLTMRCLSQHFPNLFFLFATGRCSFFSPCVCFLRISVWYTNNFKLHGKNASSNFRLTALHTFRVKLQVILVKWIYFHYIVLCFEIAPFHVQLATRKSHLCIDNFHDFQHKRYSIRKYHGILFACERCLLVPSEPMLDSVLTRFSTILFLFYISALGIHRFAHFQDKILSVGFAFKMQILIIETMPSILSASQLHSNDPDVCKSTEKFSLCAISKQKLELIVRFHVN